MTTDSQSPFYFEVADAENPDVERFNNVTDAKRYCDRHRLDYILIDRYDKETGEKLIANNGGEETGETDWVDELEDNDGECHMCGATKNICVITEKENYHQQVVCDVACDDNPHSEFYEKLPQGNSAKKEEQKKLILENVGSKEEKMTNEMTSFYEEETICSKCPLPLTEDDMAMGDGTICESCLEEKEEEKEVVEDNAFTIMLKIKEDYSLALAWATGIRNGYDIAFDGYGDDDAMVDFWKTLLNTHFTKDEWKVKIFTEFYDDYVIFNGEILEEEEFKDQYPKMVDKEGNKIIQLETGEYVTKKKKIKLNVVKK